MLPTPLLCSYIIYIDVRSAYYYYYCCCHIPVAVFTLLCCVLFVWLFQPIYDSYIILYLFYITLSYGKRSTYPCPESSITSTTTLHRPLHWAIFRIRDGLLMYKQTNGCTDTHTYIPTDTHSFIIIIFSWFGYRAAFESINPVDGWW